MKTNPFATLSAVVMTMGSLAPSPATAQTIPAIPAGSLTAFPTVVQTGTKPTLTWNISYPSVIKDYVTIDSSSTSASTVTPKQALYADVRILGAGVTASYAGGSYAFVPTEAVMSYGSTSSSSYKRIFYGTNLNVNPNTIVSTSGILTNSKVDINKPLRFGGRYYYNNQWGTFCKSSDGTDNVRTLVNGDIPPSNIPAYNAPSLESFLRPYLDSTGRVKIGPMDVIVFMELTHSAAQKSNPGYDLQDMVILVTFRTN